MRPWKKPKSKEELEKEAEEKAKDSQHHINKQKEMIKVSCCSETFLDF
jgi:hypothetical protein